MNWAVIQHVRRVAVIPTHTEWQVLVRFNTNYWKSSVDWIFCGAPCTSGLDLANIRALPAFDA